MRAWDKEGSLFRQLVDQEDGNLKIVPENNHLVRAWLPSSSMDQRWGDVTKQRKRLFSPCNYPLESWAGNMLLSHVTSTGGLRLSSWDRPSYMLTVTRREGAGGGDKGWDGWMALLTQTGVWANSGRQWRTEAWHAAVHRVAKSWTRLSEWTATITKVVRWESYRSRSSMNSELTLPGHILSLLLLVWNFPPTREMGEGS